MTAAPAIHPDEPARRPSPRGPWLAALLTVVVMPAAFGGYRPWAWSLAGVVSAGLVLAWAGLGLRGRAPIAWPPALWLPAVATAIVILWILAQALLPVPAAWANPLWGMAGDLLGVRLRERISAAPEAGLVSLIRLLSAVAIFWLALHYGRDRVRATQALHWVVIAGGVYALYGLVNFVAGNGHILWYPRTSYRGDVTGTFVNRNSYATFAGLTLLAALALAMRTFHSRWRVSDPALGRAGRTMEAMAGLPTVYATTGVVIAMAGLQSHSRMGFVATAGGLVVLLALFRLARVVRSNGTLVALGVAALGFVLLASGGTLIERIGMTTSFDRTPLFADVREMIASAPWIGSGYGSFPGIFPMFRQPSLLVGGDIVMAHNSYYELAAEIGLPATALLVLAIGWLALLCLIGTFRRTRDQAIPALAVAASVLVGIHATTDFSLQMPGVTLLYALLLGIGVAQSWSPETQRSARPAFDP